MTRPPRTRDAFVKRVIAASDRKAALEVARSRKEWCDEETARAVVARFHELVRTDVNRTEGAVRALSAVASVGRDEVCRALSDAAAGAHEYVLGRHRSAAKRLEKAAGTFEKLGLLLDAGDLHRTLVDVFKEAGDPRSAHRAAKRARRLYEQDGGVDARRLGSLAMNVGNVHWHRDEHAEALEAYGEARSHYAKTRVPELLGKADANRANVLSTLDRTEEARRLYTKARERFEEGGFDALVAQADYALATVDLLEGRLDDARQELAEVRDRKERLGDRPGVAHVDVDVAEALLRLNRPAEAAAAAQEALAFFRRTKQDAERATCLGLLGSAALQQGHSKKAARLFREARDLRRGHNAVAAALHEVGLARALTLSGSPAEALSCARRAARVLGRRKLGTRQARAFAVGAEAAAVAGRPPAARKQASEALRLARRHGEDRIRLAALVTLARLDEASGRPGAAYRRLVEAEECVERLRCGVSAEESRLAFALDKSEVYEALVSNRLAAGTPEAVRQALLHAERGKARALAERVARGGLDVVGEHTPAARRLKRRLQRLDSDLARAEARLSDVEGTPGLRTAATAELRELTRARRRELERLSRRDPAQASLLGAPLPDPFEGVKALRPGEVVLEYAESDGWLHAFLVERDDVRAFPRVARRDDVREVVNLLRFQLGKGALGAMQSERFAPFLERVVRQHLGKLHDLLLAPVADDLDSCSLRVVPHGLLHGLPFHAFERDGEPLVERCTVSYVPSLAVLGLLSSRPAPRSSAPPLVLGVPDGAAPEIEAEVECVRGHLDGARVYRGAEATAEALKLSEQRPSLLHVACHGFFSEGSALTGGLRLGDAWISLPELYRLRGTADLVVLSGCETGRGEVHSGDEWVGLVRAFLQAGARAVVASLWEVHDESTVAFMGDLHESLARGVPVAEAVALAQRAARRRQGDPLRWAPFMVLGDPGFRLAGRKAA